MRTAPSGIVPSSTRACSYIAPGHRPEFVHYAASAECEDILSALAALECEGLSPNHVQYIARDDHYEVDVDQLDNAQPPL